MQKSKVKSQKSEQPQESCAVTNLTKSSPSADELPFATLKNALLGKRYRLSVVFAPCSLMRRLNRTYRGRDKATDILSFPLSPATGEIFICQEEARAEAKRFARPYENFLAFLLIHGLLHLKGMRHSSRMEALETKFRKKFGI